MNHKPLPNEIYEYALRGLQQQLNRLTSMIDQVKLALNKPRRGRPPKSPGHKTLAGGHATYKRTAANRKAQSLAMKARWAKWHREHGKKRGS